MSGLELALNSLSCMTKPSFVCAAWLHYSFFLQPSSDQSLAFLPPFWQAWQIYNNGAGVVEKMARGITNEKEIVAQINACLNQESGPVARAEKTRFLIERSTVNKL